MESFVVVKWVSGFTLKKWLKASKKGENIGVLAFVLEVKAFLDKKVVLICCWFNENGVKVDVKELLVCQGS